VERVGVPGEGVRYTHVMDRAADNWEVFLRLDEQRCDWIVRASSLHRKVVRDAEPMSLESALSQETE
jgi:hypothetical protein